MVPHLLCLPGEIRNMIYEYALTEDDGVLYHEDEHGVGWLYLRSPNYGETIPYVRSDVDSDEGNMEHWDTDDDDDDDDDDDLESNTDSIGSESEGTQDESAIGLESDIDRSSDGKAVHLHRPWHGEPDPNHPMASKNQDIGTKQTNKKHEEGAKVAIGQRFVANQLQSVNRQLRGETKGLTVRFDTVIFRRAKNGCSEIEQCVRFLHSFSINQKGKDLVILVKELGGFFLNCSATSELMNFCLENPESVVKCHLESASLASGNYLAAARALESLFGKQFSIFSQVVPQLQQQRNIGMRLLSQGSIGILSPSAFPQNFRIFPCYEAFDEDSFKANIYGELFFQSAGRLEAMVAWAKSWNENGV